MGNRYEKVAAFTTLNGLSSAVETIWRTANYLQDYDPATGQPLVIVVGEQDGIRPNGDQLKEFCDHQMVVVNTDLAKLNVAVSDTVFRTHLSAGLDDYADTLAGVDADINSLNTGSNYYAVNISNDPQQMGALGIVIGGYSFNNLGPPAPLTEGERVVVVIHDLLEAMMHNLRNINCENGQSQGLADIDQLKSLIASRCRVLQRYAAKAYALGDPTEVDYIYTIGNYIQQEFTSISNWNKAETLALYIETNIDRLPLLRRYWSL